MPFKSALKLTSIRGSEFYKLEQPLRYYSNGLRLNIVAPEGTVTDFASIPPLIKFWMDDDGGFIRDGAVIHDYLYSNASNRYHPKMTRKVADKILIEAMADLGASIIKQRSVYWSLRLFGWRAYKKDSV